MRLHRSWDGIRDLDAAPAWLRSTVLNLARSGLRRRQVFGRLQLVPADDAPSAESHVVLSDDRRAVIEALRALPRRQREVLVLRYYADCSEAEIAAAARHRAGVGQDARAPRPRGTARRAGGSGMNDLREIEDRLRDATRAYADGVEPAPDAWDQITRRTRAASRRRRAIWIGGTSAVAAAAVFAGALLLGDNPTRRVKTPAAGPSTTTTIWRGPVREPSAVVHRMTDFGSVTLEGPPRHPRRLGGREAGRPLERLLVRGYAGRSNWRPSDQPPRISNRGRSSPMDWCSTRTATGLPTMWSASTTTHQNAASTTSGSRIWRPVKPTSESNRPTDFPGDFGYPDDQKKDPAGPSRRRSRSFAAQGSGIQTWSGRAGMRGHLCLVTARFSPTTTPRTQVG